MQCARFNLITCVLFENWPKTHKRSINTQIAVWIIGCQRCRRLAGLHGWAEEQINPVWVWEWLWNILWPSEKNSQCAPTLNTQLTTQYRHRSCWNIPLRCSCSLLEHIKENNNALINKRTTMWYYYQIQFDRFRKYPIFYPIGNKIDVITTLLAV